MTKVLAQPTRIAILQHIHKHRNCMCNDLVDIIGLSQPTISQHLNEIKKVGLLKLSFKGKNGYYAINKKMARFTTAFLYLIYKTKYHHQLVRL